MCRSASATSVCCGSAGCPVWGCCTCCSCESQCTAFSRPLPDSALLAPVNWADDSTGPADTDGDWHRDMHRAVRAWPTRTHLRQGRSFRRGAHRITRMINARGRQGHGSPRGTIDDLFGQVVVIESSCSRKGLPPGTPHVAGVLRGQLDTRRLRASEDDCSGRAGRRSRSSGGLQQKHSTGIEHCLRVEKVSDARRNLRGMRYRTHVSHSCQRHVRRARHREAQQFTEPPGRRDASVRLSCRARAWSGDPALTASWSRRTAP